MAQKFYLGVAKANPFQPFGGSTRSFAFKHSERIQIMDTSLKYEFSNETEHDVVLILEPWAEEFTIASNSVISINIFYTKMGAIEAELNPKYLILWLWGGCRAEVLLDGRNLTPASLAIPAFG